MAANYPGVEDHRGVELAHAESCTSTRRRAPADLAQPGSHHLRREPARRSRKARSSIAWSRSRCSSTCATTTRCWRSVASWMAPGRHTFRTHLHAPGIRLSRSRFVTRLTGWRVTSSPAASCRATTCLLYFQRDVRILEHWQVPGWHYQLTSEAWLRTWTAIGPKAHASCWRAPTASPKRCAGGCYWRVFFMSCAELWGYAGGREVAGIALPFERR